VGGVSITGEADSASGSLTPHTAQNLPGTSIWVPQFGQIMMTSLRG
jgi:hypothetical protein